MKSVLITGCSKGGIGDALAQEFYSKGLRVFATARNLEKIKHLKTLGLDVLQLDVTSSESIRQAVAEVEKATHGKLDFLINNAGMGYTMPLLDADLDHARQVYELNVFSVLAVTQAFAPQVIAAKGKILNIGSIVGRMTLAYSGIYNASKAALNLLSETLRLELGPLGVQVITVVTGVVKTDFFAHQTSKTKLPEDSFYLPLEDKIQDASSGKELLQNAMDPKEYAAVVVANALKPKSKLWVWTGASTLLVWFLTTFMPHTFSDTLFLKSSGLSSLPGLRQRLTQESVKN